MPERRLAGRTETVVSLAFTADGQALASGSQDFSLRVWDVATGAPLAIGSGRSHVQAVSFEPRGRLVAGGPDLTGGTC